MDLTVLEAINSQISILETTPEVWVAKKIGELEGVLPARDTIRVETSPGMFSIEQHLFDLLDELKSNPASLVEKELAKLRAAKLGVESEDSEEPI